MIAAAVRSRLERGARSPLPLPPPRRPRLRLARAAQPLRPVRPAGPQRALLVEDDPAVAAIVRHRLTKAGYVLRHVSDGTEALQALEDALPDLAILDIKLPGMDGLELLSRLRALPGASATRVIMLTASSNEHDMVRAFGLGADDYLMKPFSPTELMVRVERLQRRA